MLFEPSFSDIQTNPKIGERGLVDIYLPEGKGPFPFVLGIHGGGWCIGDRTSYNHFWPRIKAGGLAFILCSYRICQEGYYPSAYLDLVHLLKWLARHGAKYRLDPGRCALLGGSAGGHLTMLLASKATCEESGLCGIRAAVDYCGIMDLAKQYDFDNIRGHTMTFAFIGGTPTKKPARYNDASPINHVHSNMPPIWIAHGTDDPVVQIGQSRQMVEELKRHGVVVSYTEAKGRKHTLVKDDTANIENIEFLFEKDMLSFIGGHLKI